MNKRRAELYRQRQNADNFAPDTLATELRPQPSQPKQPQRQLSLDIAESDEEDGLTVEQKLRKQNAKATKAGLEALARQRGTAFSSAARMKTVTDFESDSESEEDPWPEPEPKPQSSHKEIENGDGGGSDEGVSSSDEDEESGKVARNSSQPTGVTRAILGAPKQSDKSRRFVTETVSLGKLVKGQTQNNFLPGDRVHIYYVQEALTFDGFEKETKGQRPFEKKQVGSSFGITEANAIARKRLVKPRQRKNKYLLEETDDDGLLMCTVIYDPEEKNQLKVWVEKALIDTIDVSDAELNRLELRLPPRSYTVWQFITQEEVDAETGKIHVYHQLPTQFGSFAVREMANGDACNRLCEFIKPKGAKIDEWDAWTESTNQLRGLKDQYNSEEGCGDGQILFDIEVEKSKDSCPWLDVSKVTYRVIAQDIHGPLN